MQPKIDKNAIRFLRLLEEGDFAGMRVMCTDKATVWHNDGVGDQSIDEKLAQLEPLAGTVQSMQYDVIRQFRKPDEVLQQQTLALTATDGSRTELHATMYFRFVDGLIDRIEEYAYPVPDDASRASRNEASR